MVWALAGAALGGFLQSRANKKNAKNVNKANKANAKEAARARDFNNAQVERARQWALDDNADVKEQQATQFTRLRDAATAAGFNPLTALASGHSMVAGAAGGNMAASAVQSAPAMAAQAAPLMSTEALMSGFQSVGDVLSWRAALDRAEQQSRIDLNRINAEAAGARLRLPGTARAGAPPRIGTRAAAPFAMTTGPAMASPAADQVGPYPVASFDRPTTAMRADGMTSADTEYPLEWEADVYTWARNGTLFPNASEIIRRNTPGLQQAFRDVASGFWREYPPRQIWGYLADNYRTGAVRSGAPSLVTTTRTRRERSQTVPGLGF